MVSVTCALCLLVSVQASASPSATVTSKCVVPSADGPGLPFRVQAIEVAYADRVVPAAALSATR